MPAQRSGYGGAVLTLGLMLGGAIVGWLLLTVFLAVVALFTYFIPILQESVTAQLNHWDLWIMAGGALIGLVLGGLGARVILRRRAQDPPSPLDLK